MNPELRKPKKNATADERAERILLSHMLFNPQVIDIAVETLAGILESNLNNLVVARVIRQIGKPVVLIELVLPRTVFCPRHCRFFALAGIYIFADHDFRF